MMCLFLHLHENAMNTNAKTLGVQVEKNVQNCRYWVTPLSICVRNLRIRFRNTLYVPIHRYRVKIQNVKESFTVNYIIRDGTLKQSSCARESLLKDTSYTCIFINRYC